MIERIQEISKLLALILPFVLLCIASRKVNMPKSVRSKQFPMPVITLVYAVVDMILINHINEWLIDLIKSIPGLIASFGSYSWMPDMISAMFIQLGSYVRSLLNSIDLNFWIFFISNIAIIAVYLALKRVLFPIFARAVKTDGELHTKVAENFYEYFPEKNKWCLKENFVQARSLFSVFYYSAVVLSSLLMIVSRVMYERGLFKAIFYPVFGVLLVGELFFYLDGTTKREYSGHILGEDEDAYKVVNYSLLRKFLRSVFGDKLLAENTSINNSLSYNTTTEEIIREFENSEDPKVTTFATFFDALNKTGVSLDHNYLHSSLDLLNGKSVLFNNPFYNDLIPYAFYPINRTLLSHQKVLVVLGRHSIEDDIKEWIEKGIESITNIPFMWNVGVLNSEAQNLDIGIITRSDVLDIEMHNANSEFLENVGFFVVIEPSKLISTAQIGLNMLVKKCKTEEDKKIVYCLCDKNCDGLVDAMSHILMTSITEVSATNKHQGTSSYMCWEADEDYLHHRLVPNISRYLGLGTELSLAALKNQVNKTKWYGGEAFPVTDIRWIDKQYYYDLTKYANLPANQETLDEHFITSPNFWSAGIEKHNYITVEDESNNMFEILRDFSTRTTEQGFINVISPEYLLKDYMADNASIFEADAKAIPYIVADYTRSNRNTILRLALMMSIFPVSSDVIEKELSLLGIKVFDLKQQFWYELLCCYSQTSDIAALSDDYTQAVRSAFSKTIVNGKCEWNHKLIKVRNTFNFKLGKLETVFKIDDPEFLSQCMAELRSAGYVAEDEKGSRYYLGAELSGHIYQKYLPGQFFTFGGKYYEMQYLTADGHILVRRAADHIVGRPTYRQLREYTIYGVRESDKIGACQNIAGLKITKEFADIVVNTSGYYKMERYNDFTTAKLVSFESEKNGIPKRTYFNKEILRIELPDFNGKLNDNIRYTVTVLFNEIFRTLFAENQSYICAVTDDTFIAENESEKPFTYTLKSEGYELNRNAIYIIEDSQLDLGLTVAVERNLQRILSIIYDYLDWHTETLENSLNPPPDPTASVIFDETETEEEGNKENAEKKGAKKFFGKVGEAIKKAIEKIKGWFKKKPEKDIPQGDTPEDGVAEPDNQDNADKPKKKKGLFGWLKRKKRTDEETPADEAQPAEEEQTPSATEVPLVIEITEDEIVSIGDEPSKTETEGVSDAETTPFAGDATDEDVVSQNPDTTLAPPFYDVEDAEASDCAEDTADVGFSTERKPYHKRYYMLFGHAEELPCIDLSATLEYMGDMGLQRNSLKQARNGKKIADLIEATFVPGKPDARYCDFCGSEIYGVEYETLGDGRDRCLNCSRTAIRTGEEFRKIFDDVKRNMESFFGIKINAGIKVEMVNSKKLHRRLGETFIPTPKKDGRVLGVAISDKDGYTLLVENGSPRMASMLTMAHELTHIWQYINWNDKAIRKKYGKNMRLEIYEGMAKWVEIQYAYLINEPAVAKRSEIITAYRDDEYGRGFLRYRAQYPFSLGTVITKATPFMNVETPLASEFCGSLTVDMPTNGINSGDVENKVGKHGNSGPRKGRVTNPVKGPVNRNRATLNRYAYGLLNESEKTVYDTVLMAINDFEPEVESFSVEVTDAQLDKIINYIQRDHPEIFWLQNGATFYFDKETRVVSKLELKYCLTSNEVKKRQEKIDSALKSFVSSVDSRMSDYELTLRVYEKIIRLVDYDTIGLEQQHLTTVLPDVPDDLRSIYGVFVNRKAVCSGYAKALQYLLNLFGIECVYVTSETHAWNIVKLEGDYYHLDVTWDDGSNTKAEKSITDSISYDCFCLTSEEVSRLESHTVESIMPVPECIATKCNYHRRHGLYFEKYDFERIKNIICKSVSLNKLEISFKFGSNEVYEETRKQLIDENKFREILNFVNVNTGMKVSDSYKYSFKDDRLTIAFYLMSI